MTAPTSSPAPLDISTLERVLVVVAHPDDAEYGTSAAVAVWTAAGVEVAYLLLTAGEAGMQRPPEEAGPLRALEQQNACDAVGVSRLTILDFPDGTLEYTLDLRRAIAREIRTFRPDTVVCGSGSLFVEWGVDHADHRVAGTATLDAVRDADNRWVFPELARGEDLAPWGTTRLLVIGATPTHYVEVTDEALAKAITSLEAHKAYLEDLPWHPKPADFVPSMLTHVAGVEHAVAFGLYDLRGA
jgi:LmbE family N-acetylglucosaminyl deacetylase